METERRMVWIEARGEEARWKWAALHMTCSEPEGEQGLDSATSTTNARLLTAPTPQFNSGVVADQGGRLCATLELEESEDGWRMVERSWGADAGETAFLRPPRASAEVLAAPPHDFAGDHSRAREL